MKQQKMNYKLPNFADSDNPETQPPSSNRDSLAALVPSPKKAKVRGPVDSYFQTETETVVEDPLDVMELERADLRARLDPNGGVLVQSKDSLHEQVSEKPTETSLLIEETPSTSKRKRGRPRKVITDENTKEVRQEVKDYEEKRNQQKMDYKLPEFADSNNPETQPLCHKRDTQAALVPSPKKAKEKSPVDSYFQMEPEIVIEDPLVAMDRNEGLLAQSKDSLHKQVSEKQTETSLLIEETPSTTKRKRGRPRKVLRDENTKEVSSNQRGKQMNQEPEAILKHCTTNVEENQSLPFAKTSPVWLAFDSMKTLKKFPQNPHFAPLNDLTEAHREGLAIGHMVTFTTIVEKALVLHCSDPESSFHECLEALNDLECHGFDIKPVELQIKKKLSMKEEQEKFREKAKNVEERIKALSQVNEWIDEELMEGIEKLKVLESKRCENEMKVKSLIKRVDGMKMAMELSLIDLSSL